MAKTSIDKQIIFAVAFTVFYALLSFSWHNSDLFGRFFQEALIPFGLFAVPICFLSIVVLALVSIFRIFRNVKNLSFKIFLPAIIYILSLMNTIYDPYHYMDDLFAGKVVLRACCEGTQNQAFINFRENKTFKLNWTGVFGYDEWFKGHWKQAGDTIYLAYDGKKVERSGDKIVIYKGYLIPSDLANDSLTTDIIDRQFYIGFCKGLN